MYCACVSVLCVCCHHLELSPLLLLLAHLSCPIQIRQMALVAVIFTCGMATASFGEWVLLKTCPINSVREKIDTLLLQSFRKNKTLVTELEDVSTCRKHFHELLEIKALSCVQEHSCRCVTFLKWDHESGHIFVRN